MEARKDMVSPPYVRRRRRSHERVKVKRESEKGKHNEESNHNELCLFIDRRKPRKEMRKRQTYSLLV